MKKSKKKQQKSISLSFILIVFVVLNLIIIDIWFFSNVINKKTNVLGQSSSSCPTACIDYINQASLYSSAGKEYFVPLGTGTNQTDDWQDIEGAAGYIDSTNYINIKKVTFEATVENPYTPQTSYVRLFNATDKHPVWFSEMKMEGSGPQLLVSSPITLDPGQKLYKAQMKSQLRALTKLVQARIHILTY
jgi:hypothetical protein